MTELFNFKEFLQSFPELIRRVPKTIGIVIFSFAIGLVIGFIVALIRIYKVKVLNTLSKIYVSFIRGTPLIVQLYVINYGLPRIIYWCQINKGWLMSIQINKISAEFFGLLTLSINLGAYLSEAIRASIESVDIGQFEAAKSLGMTTMQMMWRIIIPQALKVAVPNLGNTIVATTKDTSILFMIGVVDLMGQAKIFGARTLSMMEVFIAVAIIYWVICAVMMWLIARYERKLKVSYKKIMQ